MEVGACEMLTESLVSIVETIGLRLGADVSENPSGEAMAAAMIAVALLGAGATVTDGDGVKRAVRDLLREATKGLDKF